MNEHIKHYKIEVWEYGTLCRERVCKDYESANNYFGLTKVNFEEIKKLYAVTNTGTRLLLTEVKALELILKDLNIWE